MVSIKSCFWLNRIRPVNLLMILSGQLLFYSFALYPFINTQFYQYLQRMDVLFLIVFSTISAAAAGNLINDVYDINIDKFNKYTPSQFQSIKQSKRKLLFFYFLINSVAIIASVIVDVANSQFAFSPFLLIVELLLWLYSLKFKCFPIIGNILVSILVALAPIVVCFTLPIQNIVHSNEIFSHGFKGILVLFLVFSFFTNIIRESIKDIQDYKGDSINKCNTLPVVIGTKAAKNYVIILNILFSFILIYTAYLTQLYSMYVLFGYFVVLILLWIYYCYVFTKANKTEHFLKAQQIMKLFMLIGMFSLVLVGLEF